MPIYDNEATLWAFPHIDDLAALLGIGFALDPECEVLTVTYQGRQARFSTEGWAGLHRTTEHAPHDYLDFLAQVDVSSYGDFEEWAVSHDRDAGERQARVFWRYYRLLTSRLRRLFAEDFEYILHADITMSRAAAEVCFSAPLVSRFTRMVQTRTAGPELLGPQDVEPLLRAAEDQGWSTPFRHWLLSSSSLGEETRRALVTRPERAAARSRRVSDATSQEKGCVNGSASHSL